MVIIKIISISAIKWSADFERAKGSYYDYAAEIYAPSEPKEVEICDELLSKGWRKIETNNGIIIFEKERHIIRIFRIWG